MSTALFVAAALVAGCGSSESDTPSTSKDVIKIGTISPVGTALGNWPSTTAAMKAAARAINAEGGINGKEIEIVSCNDGVDPNQALSCAREMVSQKVVATVRDIVNSDPASGEAVTEALGAAGISEVFSVPRTPGQYSAKNLFPADGSSTFLYAFDAYVAAKKYGAKSLAIAAIDSPLTSLGLDAIKTAAKNANVPIKGTVKIPADAADYAPFAARVVATGADAVVLVVSPAQLAQLIPAIRANGGKDMRIMAQESVITPSLLKGLGAAGEGLTVTATIPPLSAAEDVPGLAEFLKDMKAEAESGDADAAADKLSPVDVLGWLGVHAVAKVAQDLPTVDAESVLGALQHTKDMDLKGIIKDWSPGAKGPIDGFGNVNNLKFYTYEVHDGVPTLTDSAPADGSPALQ